MRKENLGELGNVTEIEVEVGLRRQKTIFCGINNIPTAPMQHGGHTFMVGVHSVVYKHTGS